MNINMLPLEIIGLKSDLQAVLHSLRQAGCVHIDDLSESPEVSARPLTLDRETLRWQEEMGFLLARIEGLLEALSIPRQDQPQAPDKDLDAIREGVEELVSQVQALTTRRYRW